MKLLSVTSFFLFAILCLSFNSNISNGDDVHTDKFLLETYKNKALNAQKLAEYDSAIFYSKKMLQVSLKLKSNSSIKTAYDKLSFYFSKTEKYDSALYYSQKLYNLGDNTKDTLSMAKACFKKGLYNEKIDSVELAYKNFIASKNLYKQIGDSIQTAKKLLKISELEKKLGSFGESQFTALDGLEYVKNSKEKLIIGKLYYTIAVSAKEQGDFITAEQRIDQALSLAESLEKINLKFIIECYNTKANIFKEKGLYDKSIRVYENLLANNKGKLSKRQLARVNGNLADAIYIQKGYNNFSDSLLMNSLSIDKELEYTSGLHSIYLKLAKLYKEKDASKAIEYIKKSIFHARGLENENAISEALAIKIDIRYNAKDFQKYQSIRKKIRQKEYATQSLIANVKFDFDLSEKKRIEAERKELLASRTAARNRVTTLILALVLIILSITVYFIYQKIKRRHRIEKVKTVHTTEARISSKVHDELANDVYKLMTQLETSKPDREMVLDKLDSIYNNARDISKQIQNVDTGKGFADELNNLLRSYQSDDVNVLLKRYEIEIWKDISSHVKTTVYRVLQELLTNMKKHSNAVLVVVSIEKVNKKLFIQYIDNGKGFSEEISKNGLQNAENRIHAIDGSLTFDTELQKGCKFSINVPV